MVTICSLSQRSGHSAHFYDDKHAQVPNYTIKIPQITAKGVSLDGGKKLLNSSKTQNQLWINIKVIII